MSKRRARSTTGVFALALAALALTPLASGDSPDADEIWPSEPAAVEAEIVPSPTRALAESKVTSEYAVPIPTPLPPAVAIASFANQSEVSGLDWLGPASAFIAGELLAGHSKIRTLFGPLVVPRTKESPSTAAEIAAFATRNGAQFVVTGAYSRPDWELELRIELWEVAGGKATRQGLAVNRGEFKLVHQFIGRSLASLFAKAELPVEGEDRERVVREPTQDFYAFTLFGRGLSKFLTARTSRDWLEAKKNLERAVYIDPSFIEGQRILGELYSALDGNRAIRVTRRVKLASQAHTRFKRAAEARPEYAAATTALARVAESREQPERARDLYASIVRVRPYDFEARYRLGKVLWDLGQAEDSYAVLAALVVHRPDDVRARRILVMIHAARGGGEALVSELEAVAKLDPNDEQTRMDLGAAYASVERTREAAEVYREIADNNKRNVTALKFLGDLHKKLGEKDKAIKYYGLALHAAPSDPRPYFALGSLYVEEGQDAKARRIYQRAMRFRRYAPEVHTNLGGIAFRAGKLEDALAHHRKAMTAEPRRARFRYNLALALSADGQLDDADKEIAVGLRYDRRHISLNYLKGVVLLRRGDVDAAAIQFEKTLELDPEHEDAQHNVQLISELRRRAEEGELIKERPL